MINLEEVLLDNGYEGAIYFTDECYNDAVIGVTATNQVVYDYDLLIEGFMKENDCSWEEAADWVNYNTLGTNVENGPIVLYKLLY